MNINNQQPLRFFSNEDSIVFDCCKPLLNKWGKQQAGKSISLDELLHLDGNTKKILMEAQIQRQAVCLRASVRIGDLSLLPVFWTVLPKGNGWQWYGFPLTQQNDIDGRLNELELLVSSLADVVLELDKDGNYLNFWVKDPNTLFIAPSQFLGKNVKDIIPQYFGSVANQLLSSYHEAAVSKSISYIEYELPGTNTWYSCRHTPLLDPSGEMLGMIKVIMEITTEKKLENQLRQSEKQYRDLFENANDIIYIVDNENIIQSINKKGEELLEYKEEELLGKTECLFFPPEKYTTVEKKTKLKRSGFSQVTVYESEFISKSGKRIPVEISSRLISNDNKMEGIHCTARDLRNQKKSQSELAKSEARFRFLSEYARDLICLHGPNGDYIYVSPSSQQMLGFDCDELSGHSPYEFVHPDDIQMVISESQKFIQNGKDIPPIQYRFLRKDGSFIWLETVARPILDEGELIYVQTNSRNITYRKQVEQQLVEKDRLSSALANASRLLLVTNSLEEGLKDSLPILGDAVRSECLFVLKLTSQEQPELFQIWCETNPCSVKEKVHLFTGAGLLFREKSQVRSGKPQEFQVISEQDPVIAKWMKDLGYKSLLIIPILTDDGCWGVLGCGQKKSSREFSLTVTDTLCVFASSVSSVIEKNCRDLQLRQSEARMKQYSDKVTGMLSSITDGFIALDEALNITMCNTVAKTLLKYNSKLEVGANIFDVFQNVKESNAFKAINQSMQENKTIRFEQYFESLNCWFEASVFPYEEGVFIYFKDATEKKRQAQLLELEKEVLEMHTGGKFSLTEIADHMLKGIETLNSDLNCALCLVKNKLPDVYCVSAPNLHQEFRDFLDYYKVDAACITCSRAILNQEQLILNDIEKSDLAESARLLAKNLGIKASWTIPLLSSSNEILGSFAVYFRTARQASQEEISMISRVTHILTMIIENKQVAEKLRISNERYILATRASNEAIWDWDALKQVSFWGEGFNTLFGYPSQHYPGNSMNWENKIHPDDLERVLNSINQYVTGKKKGLYMEEYRLLKADGAYALVIDKGYCLYNEKGEVIRMIGSCEDITERKALEEKLIQQEIQKQKQIAQTVVEVQENERAEIGKELHDNVNQLLTTAKLFLEVAHNDPGLQHQMIRRSSDTIMNAINEIRQISRSLMPASISDLGLLSSVNDLVQNISLASKLKVAFRYNDAPDEMLQPKQKLMLFRIIQEQVNNVIKHAKSKKLLIDIKCKKDSVRLEITDDGIGFDLTQAKQKDGVGLSNIMSRAAIFDAQVEVVTAPGKGCKLIIDLPYTKKLRSRNEKGFNTNSR